MNTGATALRSLAIALTTTAGTALAQCEDELVGAPWVIPGIAGDVKAVTDWDPDGIGPLPPLLVFGGRFRGAGPLDAPNIVAWDPASRTWHALGSGTVGDVLALCALADGRLIAAGDFSAAGGVAASRIAVWDGVEWSALGAGCDDTVYSLAPMTDGSVIAGGRFQQAGAVATARVARWDGAAWHPIGAGLGAIPFALASTNDGRIFAGGDFAGDGLGGTTGVREWNGAAWTAPAIGGPASARALLVTPDGSLISASAAVSGLGRIDLWSGAAWQSLGQVAGSLGAIARAPDGRLIVGTSTNTGLAFEQVGAAWRQLGAPFIGPLTCLAFATNGAIYAAGSVYGAGSQGFCGVAEWRDGAWSPLSRGLVGTVEAMTEMSDGSLLLGGLFTAVDGTTAAHLARFDGESWSAFPGNPTNSIRVLKALSNGDVVAGGRFLTMGGAVNHLARWNGSGWSSIGGGTNGTDVRAIIELPNGELVVGGQFTMAGGTPANNIARWDGSRWWPLGAGVNQNVNSIAVFPNGDLAVGGGFTGAGGRAIANLARWDGVAWSAIGGGVSAQVATVLVDASGRLIVNGAFTLVGGSLSTGGLAMWDGASWTTFNEPGFGTLTRQSMALLPNGDLVATAGVLDPGGSFYRLTARAFDGSAWREVGPELTGSAVYFVRSSGELAIATTANSVTVVGGGLSLINPRSVPVLLAEPRPLLDCGTASVTFDAHAAGTRPLNYRWQREFGGGWADLQDGATTGGAMVQGARTERMLLSGAGGAESGRYRCVIENGCGQTTSRSYDLALCPADVDCSGGVDHDDIVAFFGGWDGAKPESDFDRDGAIDGDDVIAFFFNWDSGC